MELVQTFFQGDGGASTLDGLTDVTAPSPSSGDFLKWNGSAWVNDAIDLSTDTTGSYVASLVAGTGISLSNNSGEGATPTISIDSSTVATLTGTQTLSNKTLSNPTILGAISLPQYIIFEGSVDDIYETVLSVVEPTADRLITLPNATGTLAIAGSIALGTDTTGDYVSSLVAGSGITITNNSGEGSTPTIALTNSSVTVNGTSISLGGSATITAAAGTLTGTTLNSTVVSSSLTSVGTLSSLTVTNNVTAAQYYGRARDTEIRFFMEVI